jgi:hypothetical protein
VVTGEIQKAFPGVPVLSIPGNDDRFPDYAFNVSSPDLEQAVLAGSLSSHIDIGSTAQQTCRSGGFYASEVHRPPPKH